MSLHVRVSPLHSGARDDAGDRFRDSYGGTMITLWGLLPVMGGWGGAMSAATRTETEPDGLSLRAGVDEHNLMR
jgi:hypothetical protein